ncbi:MAG: LPS translocon maturation chaperone LptM [Oscillospiraceae bacterium]
MKKFFALLLSLAMVLALVACGQKDPTPTRPIRPTIPRLRSSTRSP